MRLYEALTFLQDAGFGQDMASIYLMFDRGVMLKIDDALEEEGFLASQVREWFDNRVIDEPHLDGGGRWVFNVGAVNGNHPDSDWDGFWTDAEFAELYENWDPKTREFVN